VPSLCSARRTNEKYGNVTPRNRRKKKREREGRERGERGEEREGREGEREKERRKTKLMVIISYTTIHQHIWLTLQFAAQIPTALIRGLSSILNFLVPIMDAVGCFLVAFTRLPSDELELVPGQ
jgi:hypothetical protein